MTGRRAAKNSEPRFPRLVERFGEDPDRWLSKDYQPEARVRGIQSRGLLQLYLNLELRVYGGRRRVLSAVGRRQAELEEYAGSASDATVDEAPVAADGGVADGGQ